MRLVSDRAVEARSSGFNLRLIVDVFNGPERVFKDLPVVGGWEFTWDSETSLKSSGKLTVVYSSDVAASLKPTQFTDLLAPFGAELNVMVEMSVGDIFSETFLLGRFPIKAVPDARDEHMSVSGRLLTVGSVIDLQVVDPMLRLQRWGFPFEEQPADGVTCFSEIRRITGFQITESVEDDSVPEGLLYEPKSGGRLAAVQTLAGKLGGKAYMTPDNTLSILPDTVPLDPVLTLEIGERGTVLDVGHSMDSEEVFNEVVGVYEQVVNGERLPLFSIQQIQSGPLSVNGSYGHYTYYHTSKNPNDQVSADAETAAVLAQVSSAQTYRVPFECLYDPRPQMGDVILIERPVTDVIGRIVKLSLSSDGLLSGELEVSRPVPL